MKRSGGKESLSLLLGTHLEVQWGFIFVNVYPIIRGKSLLISKTPQARDRYQCHHLGFDFGPKQYQTLGEDVDISGIIEENGEKIGRHF